MAEREPYTSAERAGAEVLLRNYSGSPDGYHLMAWEDFADQAREILAAAGPHLRKQVAAEIRAHADKHWPNDGSLSNAQAAIRRHLRIAEQVALGPASPIDIAEAIRSGNVIVCHVNDIGESIDPTTDQGPTS